jgi:3-oxoacyl-[acyl-carrier-protein] synthase II
MTQNPPNRRVVITGIGVATPIGLTPDALHESIKAGRSGITTMHEWAEFKDLGPKVAGAIREAIDFAQIPRKYRRSMDRVAMLAAYTTQQAIEDSKLPDDLITHPRTGLSFGSTMGGNHALFDYIGGIEADQSFRNQNSMGFLKIMSHTVAANLAQMFQVIGRNIPTCSACTSSSQAIGAAYESIKYDLADVMLCGGSEGLHHLEAGVFDIISATSTRYNDSPSQTPRPFDKERDGLVVAEGGGTLILEEYEHAKKRGAPIYGEIIGYATNCDGSHITTPSKEGMQAVMELVLKQAGIRPEEVGYINAHATATTKGDIAESRAVHDIFGKRTPISSTKGYMGHLLGGCGVVESVIALQTLAAGYLPANRNLNTPDEACAPLDYLTESREAPVSITMNNNFAFGGINTALLFQKIN